LAGIAGVTLLAEETSKLKEQAGSKSEVINSRVTSAKPAREFILIKTQLVFSDISTVSIGLLKINLEAKLPTSYSILRSLHFINQPAAQLA
jgi:hypothetical protein